MPDYLFSHTSLSYDDVVPYAAGNDPERLVDSRLYDPSIVCRYDKQDMIAYTGEVIYLRDSLARKLAQVSEAVSRHGYKLKVVYGYRHPDVQRLYFETRRGELALQFPELTQSELDRATHYFVAVPDVAGHPTGGAVDLTLIDQNNDHIDMGTKIADYSDPLKIRTFTDDLSETVMNSRMLLHDLMVEAGFAPFYGEWWHFSYGDREWASFYDMKKALYGAIYYDMKS